MDCLYTNVRINNVSEKIAVYVALGIDITGQKEVIGFWEGESESSSFWYGILEELKQRGVKDILFLCTDGVSGFKEILEQVYPRTKHQRCIVHIIRNMTPCVLRKNMQELCNDLKLIYKTNPVESLNSCIRKVTNGKGCFVSLEALEKVLYLRIKDLSEKWKRNTKAGWSIILNELIEIYGERVEKYISI